MTRNECEVTADFDVAHSTAAGTPIHLKPSVGCRRKFCELTQLCKEFSMRDYFLEREKLPGTSNVLPLGYSQNAIRCPGSVSAANQELDSFQPMWLSSRAAPR